MGNKVNIFADVTSFLNLLANPEFAKGRDLKSLIRQRAEVFLIVDQEELDRRWEDAEDTLRKLCDAYDIPCPRALPKLAAIFESPDLCVRLDPFGLWMINASEQDINRFREYLGVWMVNPSSIMDDIFYLHHKRDYNKGDIIDGSSNDNGWANYIEELSLNGKRLPPINSVVINDRYLLLTTSENISPEKYASYSLNNLKKLFDALLPQDLKISFQLTIYCDHPKLDIATTDKITQKFKDDMQHGKPYPIQIEFIYDHARHKRTFHSNYFLFDVDRAYNAFDCRDYNKLIGENYFCLESYHNDSCCSGDTNFITARNTIMEIKKRCDSVLDNLDTSNLDYSKIKRCDLITPHKIQNRLFD